MLITMVNFLFCKKWVKNYGSNLTLPRAYGQTAGDHHRRCRPLVMRPGCCTTRVARMVLGVVALGIVVFCQRSDCHERCCAS
jgi:POT family proton-dependent oligopeptide transporter